MTVDATEIRDYFAIENLEKAKENVVRIISENNFELRENIKDGYGNYDPTKYSEHYVDWSVLSDQYLTTTKSSDNPMYALWSGMRARCTNSNSMSYGYYGERGISMYSEWQNNFTKFANDILATLGRKPHPFYSIDRIDNNGNYEPGNIRWASPLKQARNRGGSLKVSEVSGLTIAILYKYCKVTGSKLKDIYNNYLAEDDSKKIKKGWGPIYTAAKSYNDFV